MTGAEGINYCTIRINDKKCTRCYNCINTCETGALTLEQCIFIHNAYECSYCKECEIECNNKAIEILEM